MQHGEYHGGHQDGQLWIIADQVAAEIPAEGHLLPQDGEQKEPGVSGYRLRDRPPEGLSGEGIEPGDLQKKMDQEVRITVPGHTQRGGSPCPYDRVLATRLGAAAAERILEGDFGYMMAIKSGEITKVPLAEVAGKLKCVDPEAGIIQEARMTGISFGDR